MKCLILKFPAYHFVLKNYGFSETTFLSWGIFHSGGGGWGVRPYRLGMTLCYIVLHVLLYMHSLATLAVCTPPSFLKK